MIHSQHYNLYISSCCKNGGIYHCTLDKSGRLEICDKVNLEMPMYTVSSANKLYALLRKPFIDNDESGLVCLNIEDDMKLTLNDEIFSTKGEVACHLCVNGNDIFAVNYISGSVILLPDILITHTGKSINTKRQEKSHTHYVSVTTDNKYILVTDLGMDKIFTYDLKLNYVCSIDTAKGAGPRHLAFSENGKFVFCVNELSSTLALYEYFDGKLTLCDEHSTLPENCDSMSTAAAVRFHQNQVFASNRGHDSIAVFDFDADSKKIKLRNILSCGGHSPRDFLVIGDFIISANEGSNNICVINKNGDIAGIYNGIEAPVCITCVDDIK